MKETGQRQDVAFLALVVAVLAVAVAIFVGMRSMRKERPKRVAPKPATAAQVVAPKIEKPTGGPRDPFKGGEEGKGPAGRGGPVSPEQSLKLVGIVSERGSETVAIIHSTRKHYYARVGGRAAGYTVTSIGANQAVLQKGEDRLVLQLREPEPKDE